MMIKTKKNTGDRKNREEEEKNTMEKYKTNKMFCLSIKLLVYPLTRVVKKSIFVGKIDVLIREQAERKI